MKEQNGHEKKCGGEYQYIKKLGEKIYFKIKKKNDLPYERFLKNVVLKVLQEATLVDKRVRLRRLLLLDFSKLKFKVQQIVFTRFSTVLKIFVKGRPF